MIKTISMYSASVPIPRKERPEKVWIISRPGFELRPISLDFSLPLHSDQHSERAREGEFGYRAMIKRR
jgi:hypothetical protein